MSYFSELDAAREQTEQEVVSYLETARRMATNAQGITDLSLYRDYQNAKQAIRRRLRELETCPIPGFTE